MSQEASGDEASLKKLELKLGNSPSAITYADGDNCNVSDILNASANSSKDSPVENGIESMCISGLDSVDRKSLKCTKPVIGQRKSNRIRVSGASQDSSAIDMIENLFGKYGNVNKVEPHNYNAGVLVVNMASIDEANSAVEALQNYEFMGKNLRLNNDWAGRQRNNTQQGGNVGRGQPMNGSHISDSMTGEASASGNMHRDNYPVRILVNSDLVGAVIGKGGETIREITNRTKARVDVKREVVQRSQNNKKQVHSQIVFVYGAPESASEAVKEILSICLREASDKSKDEPDLGLLAEDRFCGRIIGKDGKNLNSIREKSSTVIQLSNSPTITTLDPQTFSLDRIITVKGSLDGMFQAEVHLSQKLRSCHLLEVQHYQTFGSPNVYMQSGYPGTPMVPGGYGPGRGMPYYGGGPSFYPHGPGNMNPATINGMMGASQYNFHQHPHPPPGPGGMQQVNANERLDEALYMRIPHVSAGAVIGTDGASIKKIMEETKTYVNVSKVNIESKSKGDSKPEQPQRLVTIKGPPNNQCRAQWQIFQRVKSSSRQGELDILVSDREIKLWTVLRVPRKIVGRIIGKHGKVVRHIQANTGTIIHLPEDVDLNESDQPVEIFGNFDSTQLALARVRALLSQIQGMASSGAGPMPYGVSPYSGNGCGSYMGRGTGNSSRSRPPQQGPPHSHTPIHHHFQQSSMEPHGSAMLSPQSN